MKEQELIGQFCLRTDGNRMLVQELAEPLALGMPILAVGLLIDGPDAGSRSRNFVTSLKPLGREVPKEKP